MNSSQETNDTRNSSKSVVCIFCNIDFPSKTKLFQHLCLVHGLNDPQYDKFRLQRVALLVGWIHPRIIVASDCDQVDSKNKNDDGDDNSNDSDNDDISAENWLTEERKLVRINVDNMERYLLAAIYAVENNIDSVENVPTSSYEKYPKGYSRCSRSSQRTAFNMGIETSTHGLADVICMTLLRLPEDSNSNNNGDDDGNQSHSCDDIHDCHGHQEGNSVENWLQKVNAFLPNHIRVHYRYSIPSGASDFNAEISANQRRYEVMLPLWTVLTDQYMLNGNNRDDLEPISTKKSHISDDTMDYLFPRDTPEGIARIEYFVLMKKVMKLYNTSKSTINSGLSETSIKSHRFCFHNYVNGGITSDEAASRRRIDRFYHKQLLSFPDYGGTWVVFSLSGDDFLHGQVRRIIATVLAIMRGWLPQEYIQASLNPNKTLFLPLAPSWSVYFAECRYITTETKYINCFLDPRRNPNGNTSRLDSWLNKLQHHIASIGWKRSERWLSHLHVRCDELMKKYTILQSLSNRNPTLLQNMYQSSFLDEQELNVPKAYIEVLRLLREADQSGLWPSTSMARQRVIYEIDGMNKTNYGSFSVGCLPKPLLSPKGNHLFPDLTIACFALEKVLRPDRSPSSTIAINRHAQFKIHRDSGAGNGQSISMIVALGNFVGGELLVEDEAIDIRYKPYEFDGWSKRHGTLPFVGERYTLVWFSPDGVDQKDMFWLDLPGYTDCKIE